MDLFPDLDLSSAVLLMKYGPLPKRKIDITSALRSGMNTSSRTTGATALGQPSARPTSSGLKRLDDEELLSRLWRLAHSERPANAAPFDSYRTEAQEHGTVYIATNEWRVWFHRTHPRAGERSEVPRPVVSSPVERQGKSKRRQLAAF